MLPRTHMDEPSASGADQRGAMSAAAAEHPLDPGQEEVAAFLAAWAAGQAGRRFSTHAAHVFVAGGEALKIKRAVRYPYLDFSSLDLRRRACERELEVNRANAPDIYLAVVPITRERDGRLAVGGKGAPVEWAVRMRAFHQADLLGARAAEGELDAAVAEAVADAVFDSHTRAPVARDVDTPARLAAIADQLAAGLAGHGALFPAADCDAFRRGADAALERARGCLERRAAAGCVRRVHGDLHLDNVVLWQGRPVLFDAIEFDEALATIDTLYDLAFLLMDLDHRGRRASANRVLNRYLWRARSDLDLEGLVALPLLLALRAGVRALVAADTLHRNNGLNDGSANARARGYLAAALGFLAPAPPCLVAVGGLSGTGKSTLAAALAPSLGPSPGALHLRSDLERKSMLGVAATARLGAQAYTPAARAAVYGTLVRKARLALAAGHAVVVDAVFAQEGERAAVEAAAGSTGAPFRGLWLSAPPETLLRRVDARTGDASDATAAVVRRQLSRPVGAVAWTPIDAGGPPGTTEAVARRALGL